LKKQLNSRSDSELILLVSEQKDETSYAFSELYDRHSVTVRNFIHYMIQSGEQSEEKDLRRQGNKKRKSILAVDCPQFVPEILQR